MNAMPRFSDERTIGKDFNPAPRGLDRAYYSDRIEHFLERASDEILGALSRRSAFVIESTQKQAWLEQIRLLKEVLQSVRRPGKVYFEYSVPRLGKRIDVVLLLGEIIFVLEFKVGETEFRSSAIDQVLDYALDLKNFHETSRDKVIVPILVATRAESTVLDNENSTYADAVNTPLLASASTLESIISNALDKHMGPDIQAE
ncbi:MAG: hypothetical protein ABIT64_06720, partial [Lysobacteraceae bacterium]